MFTMFVMLVCLHDHPPSLPAAGERWENLCYRMLNYLLPWLIRIFEYKILMNDILNFLPGSKMKAFLAMAA